MRSGRDKRLVTCGALLAAVLAAGMFTGGAAQGADDFTDVPASHPQREAILFAAEQGWFRGYPDGTFRPDRAVSDQQLAAVVRRAFPDGASRADLASFMWAGSRVLPQPPVGEQGCGWPVFTDVDYFHPQAWDIKYAADYGWFEGYPDGTFRPDRAVSDQQLAAVVRRAFPDGASRADLASFMRAGSRALGRVNQARDPSFAEFFTYVVRVEEEGGRDREQLWVAGTDGSDPRLLTDNANYWRWSPDGGVLAYTVDGNPEQVWAYNAATGRNRMLGEHPKHYFDGYLGWSGDIITYSVSVSANGRRQKLWLYEGPELEPRLLSNGKTGFLRQARGNGDIKFSVSEWDENDEQVGRVWSYDKATSRQRLLTSRSGRFEQTKFSHGDKCMAYLAAVADDAPAPDATPGDSVDFSADGDQSFALASFARPPVLTELWMVDFGGEGPRRLLDHPDYFESYKWSPDGSRLAYQVENVDAKGRRTGEAELWVVDTTGMGSPHQLTDSATGDHDYEWSLGGESIAYKEPVYDDNGDWLRKYKLTVVDMETLTGRQLTANLTPDDEFYSGYSWVPGGRNIGYAVVVRDETGEEIREELWVADTDGTNRRLVTDRLADVRVKTVPGGEILPYVTSASMRWLFRYRPTEPGEEIMAYATEVRDADGVWASDELWVAGGDGSRPRRLADGLPNVYWLDMSPDGEKIAYWVGLRDDSGRSAGQELWLADGDGSPPRRLAVADSVNFREWSRSGLWLTYSQDGGLWMARADGTASRLLSEKTDGNGRWN